MHVFEYPLCSLLYYTVKSKQASGYVLHVYAYAIRLAIYPILYTSFYNIYSIII